MIRFLPRLHRFIQQRQDTGICGKYHNPDDQRVVKTVQRHRLVNQTNADCYVLNDSSLCYYCFDPLRI